MIPTLQEVGIAGLQEGKDEATQGSHQDLPPFLPAILPSCNPAMRESGASLGGRDP
jgi:hypothetical protein